MTYYKMYQSSDHHLRLTMANVDYNIVIIRHSAFLVIYPNTGYGSLCNCTKVAKSSYSLTTLKIPETFTGGLVPDVCLGSVHLALSIDDYQF